MDEQTKKQKDKWENKEIYEWINRYREKKHLDKQKEEKKQKKGTYKKD